MYGRLKSGRGKSRILYKQRGMWKEEGNREIKRNQQVHKNAVYSQPL
jgi:hypothetical protein